MDETRGRTISIQHRNSRTPSTSRSVERSEDSENEYKFDVNDILKQFPRTSLEYTNIEDIPQGLPNISDMEAKCMGLCTATPSVFDTILTPKGVFVCKYTSDIGSYSYVYDYGLTVEVHKKTEFNRKVTNDHTMTVSKTEKICNYSIYEVIPTEQFTELSSWMFDAGKLRTFACSIVITYDLLDIYKRFRKSIPVDCKRLIIKNCRLLLTGDFKTGFKYLLIIPEELREYFDILCMYIPDLLMQVTVDNDVKERFLNVSITNYMLQTSLIMNSCFLFTMGSNIGVYSMQKSIEYISQVISSVWNEKKFTHIDYQANDEYNLNSAIMARCSILKRKSLIDALIESKLENIRCRTTLNKSTMTKIKNHITNIRRMDNKEHYYPTLATYDVDTPYTFRFDLEVRRDNDMKICNVIFDEKDSELSHYLTSGKAGRLPDIIIPFKITKKSALELLSTIDDIKEYDELKKLEFETMDKKRRIAVQKEAIMKLASDRRFKASRTLPMNYSLKLTVRLKSESERNIYKLL